MSSLSIGKAWEEASRFLTREMRLVVPVALAFFAVPTALARWANPSDQMTGSAGLLVPLFVLLTALMGYMTISALALGWGGSVGGAIAKAFRHVWGLTAAMLMLAIPITIVAVVALMALLAGANISDPSQLTPAALSGMPGFGAFALILFVTILLLGARLFPISAVAITETSSPVRLLVRTWRLTKGNFGRFLGVFALILIAGGVARLAVIAVVGSAVTVMLGTPKPFSLSSLIIALAVGLVAAAISAIGAALVGRSYAQLSAGQTGVPEVKREE